MRPALSDFERPRWARGGLDLATSVPPYTAILGSSFVLLDEALPLAIGLALVAGAFLTRIYALMHDCAHGSLLPSRAANVWAGRLLAFLTFRGYAVWRREHAGHHGSVGHLDRRGPGLMTTWTVSEYEQAERRWRAVYRLVRSPLFIFAITPFVGFFMNRRIPRQGASRRERRSVVSTDIGLTALIVGLVTLTSWQSVIVVLGCAIWVGGAGIAWLFYTSHQFEDVYWRRGEDWNYGEAALYGSSFILLPPVLRFFTANMGWHHVHHVSSRIPNYELRRAHQAIPLFQEMRPLSFVDSLRSFRLKLYDESRGKLVPFVALREETATAPGPVTPQPTSA